MRLHETDPAPRWPQGPGRTVAQRAAAAFLLAVSLGSAAYWALHGLPDGAPMPTPLLLCLLAMAPVGLWLLLACPPLRPQRPDELAVFHAGWSTPVGVVLVVLYAGFAAALPTLLTGDDLVAGLVTELLLLVWLALSALIVAAARNERLLLAADGRIETTGAGGRTRIVEPHEAASLRLCVNQAGERMDANLLGDEVQDINVLTVIASESYESFAKGLQHEIAEAVPDRPRIVDADLFENKLLRSAAGEPIAVDKAMANAIVYGLIKQDYIDSRGTLTEKFFTERRNGSLQFAPEAAGYEDSVLQILNSVYSDKAVTIEDARRNNIELQVDRDKLAMPQFKALWKRINAKSVYTVEFDSEELVRHCVEALDRHLNVRKIYFRVEEGEMNKIRSKEALESGEAFQRTDTGRYSAARRISVNSAVKYDLIGKLVEETGLTRHTVVQILTGIQKAVFDQFKDNPEEFILKAAQLINDEKATAIIQHITYHCLDDRYDTRIFTGPTIKGKLGDNAIKTQKHLYDYLVSDSQTERDFAQEMDAAREVAVYVKLPGGFYISTPVGRYNPDWAVAFYEGTVKHIYFVAETKGTMRSMQLRKIEESKIHCAREHFRAISGSDVVYDVVDSYETLLDLMRR